MTEAHQYLNSPTYRLSQDEQLGKVGDGQDSPATSPCTLHHYNDGTFRTLDHESPPSGLNYRSPSGGGISKVSQVSPSTLRTQPSQRQLSTSVFQSPAERARLSPTTNQSSGDSPLAMERTSTSTRDSKSQNTSTLSQRLDAEKERNADGLEGTRQNTAHYDAKIDKRQTQDDTAHDENEYHMEEQHHQPSQGTGAASSVGHGTRMPSYMRATAAYESRVHAEQMHGQDQWKASLAARALMSRSKPGQTNGVQKRHGVSKFPRVFKSTTKINAMEDIKNEMSSGDVYVPLAVRIKMFEKELGNNSAAHKASNMRDVTQQLPKLTRPRSPKLLTRDRSHATKVSPNTPESLEEVRDVMASREGHGTTATFLESSGHVKKSTAQEFGVANHVSNASSVDKTDSANDPSVHASQRPRRDNSSLLASTASWRARTGSTSNNISANKHDSAALLSHRSLPTKSTLDPSSNAASLHRTTAKESGSTLGKDHRVPEYAHSLESSAKRQKANSGKANRVQPFHFATEDRAKAYQIAFNQKLQLWKEKDREVTAKNGPQPVSPTQSIRVTGKRK